MPSPVIIGRILATEKAPTTIDNFAFWTNPSLILNPFDIVKVEHVNGSFSYGMIEDISHITDAASFLTNYISSDFGDVEVESPTLRVGMNYVQAKVVCNDKNIYIPLQSNSKVFLATAEEIEYALGLKDIRNPLVCGYLEMYEGTSGSEKVTLPVRLNSKFIIGPEGAHLNISGISGLAAKTSYAMFLMKAIQDTYIKNKSEDESVAYKELTEKLPLEEKTELYLRLEQAACLHYETATKEEILKLDEFVAPLFKKHFKHTKKVKRIVDFNQGIDARLINDQNMAKLAEINISPLRIAFDHWEQKDIYEKAVRTAVAHGITNLSNYMLYNFRDKPEHLYYRMKLNVDLCDELGANIYSFPMKYHPINDPDFFMNRDYIGEHWNRKFIRAIQAVLNSTKGKVGKGKHFFEEAFGADEHRFWTILWMPETFIIYRFMFKENLAKEWEEKFWSLPTEELEKVKSVVAVNKFKDLDFSKYSKEARDVLQYYMVTRDEAEQMLKEKNS